MTVDCHSHIYFEQFEADRKKVIERAGEALKAVAVAGCDPETNRKTVELCSKEEFLIPNLGLHPTFTESFDDLETVKEQIRNEDPPLIGEIGLDYHHVEDTEMRKRQESVFRELLELAEELNKPVVVHSRDAEQKAVETVEDFEVSAFFHCFNGTLQLAQRAVDDGNIIGITAQVLYSTNVQKLATELPLQKIVTETDSPFLHPDGRNEPGKVVEVEDKIAELRDDQEQVKRKLSSNGRSLLCS